MTRILKINDQELTSKDLFPLLAQYGMIPQLAREVLIEQAIADIECSEDEKNLARQSFFQQHQINPEQLPIWLDKQGINSEQLEQIIYRKIKLEKFKESTWSNQIENYFLKRKAQLDMVIYSLIRTQDVGIAQELYFRIQEKEKSFAELSRQYSQGQEAQTGGLIGPVELSNPHPILTQMLSASKPGQLWPPQRVGDWWIIVRLEEIIPANLDDRMRQKLFDELFQNWLEQKIQEKVSFYSKGENSEEK